MNKKSLSLTCIFVLLFILSCSSLPFTVSIDVRPSMTNALAISPTGQAITVEIPSATYPGFTETVVPTKKEEPTPDIALTSTSKAEELNAEMDKCMKDVPIQGDSNYRNVFCEDFTDNTNKWSVGTNEDPYYGTFTTSIKNSQYVWDTSSTHGVFHWECIDNMPEVNNFEASIEVQKLHGSTTSACYALMFRVQRADESEDWNYYSYFVCDNNKFWISRKSNTVWTLIHRWESAGAVKPGSANWLTVVADGSRFIFYVNGYQTGWSQDNKLNSGEICLGINLPEEIGASFAFDKLAVRAP